METLQRCPETLVDVYRNLYQEVYDMERNGRTIAMKTFTWLLYAQRMLSVEEALAIFRHDRDYAGCPWIVDLTIDDILACCCSMVIIDKQLNVLRFAHASVREYDYFTRDCVSLLIFGRFFESLDEYDPGRAHLALAQRCLDSYILKPNHYAYDDLSDYSSVYWGFHCENASNKLSMKPQLVDFLYRKEYLHDCLDDMQRSLNRFDRTSILYKKLQAIISDPVTPLFAISCFGLAEALDERLLDGLNLQLLNHQGVSSLYLAARWGHTCIVQHLLDCDVGIDAAGGIFGSVLQAASFEGHIEIVKRLIHAGHESLNSDEYPNAIQAALTGGYESIAQLLLNHGYGGRESIDENLDAVLNFALFEGNLNIVKCLARAGCAGAAMMDTPL